MSACDPLLPAPEAPILEPAFVYLPSHVLAWLCQEAGATVSWTPGGRAKVTFSPESKRRKDANDEAEAIDDRPYSTPRRGIDAADLDRLDANDEADRGWDYYSSHPDRNEDPCGPEYDRYYLGGDTSESFHR